MCIEGNAPGPIIATILHGGEPRALHMTLLRHPAGGWHILQNTGAFGPRCHAAPTAILLEASEALLNEQEACDAMSV
jgi:hypothetical protein